MTFEELLRSAEDGDAQSQYQLSRYYYEGDGVAKDERRGMMWLEKAAEAGLLDAMTTLAVLLRTGRDPENVMRANELLKKAADAENLHAILTLAMHHFLGIGLDKNFIEACALVMKACLLGAPEDNEVVKAQLEVFTEEEISTASDRIDWPNLWITFGPPATKIMKSEFEEFQNTDLNNATVTKWFQFELENVKTLAKSQEHKPGTMIDVLWNEELRIRGARAAVTTSEQGRFVTCQISFKDILRNNNMPIFRQPNRDAINALSTLLATIEARNWVNIYVVW